MRHWHTLLASTLLLWPLTGSGDDVSAGQQAFDIGNYETAMAEWAPLAEQGEAMAQFGLGLLYANGYGVPLDDMQAFSWYTLAAEQGHAEAQCNLAVLYANGWGTEQSDAAAFKWYLLAADQGVVEAQKNIARLFLYGFGAEKDEVQALKWYSIATMLDDRNASYKRDDLSKRMTEAEIAEAEQLAQDWFQDFETLHANQ